MPTATAFHLEFSGQRFAPHGFKMCVHVERLSGVLRCDYYGRDLKASRPQILIGPRRLLRRNQTQTRVQRLRSRKGQSKYGHEHADRAVLLGHVGSEAVRGR